MFSSADLPACPACGCREVHGVRGQDGRTLYACRQCGRDQTEAWEAVQPKKRPKPKPVVNRPPPPDKETIFEAAMRLGICAELKGKT